MVQKYLTGVFILTWCEECGLCREACPVFRVLRRESVSPRGFAILQKKHVYSKVFLMCTLCDACKKDCDFGVDLGLESFREELIEVDLETDVIKKIRRSFKKNGHPFFDIQ